MQFLKIFSVLRILLSGRDNIPIIFSLILGLSFSMAVILSTIGIMDGFDYSVRKALREINGDFSVTPYSSLIFKNAPLERFLRSWKKISKIDFCIKMEGFLIQQNTSWAVMIHGVEGITTLKDKEVAIGSELAINQRYKVGDTIVIAMASGNNETNSLPKLTSFRIAQIVHHGLYEKDLRNIYVQAGFLQKLLGWVQGESYNALQITLHPFLTAKDLEEFNTQAKTAFEIRGLRLTPYYHEYGPLLTAVQMEKKTIGLILQIIVVVSIFNCVAFQLYLKEKKSKELFLFEALGLERKWVQWVWPVFSLLIMPICIGISFIFVKIFNIALGSLSVLKLPGEIYHLSRLQLVISHNNLLFVFCSTTISMLIVTKLISRSWKNISLLSQLRKEFH